MEEQIQFTNSPENEPKPKSKKLLIIFLIGLPLLVVAFIGFKIFSDIKIQREKAEALVLQQQQDKNKMDEIIQKEKAIIGEWFPLNTSMGGIGTGLTFIEGGKVNITTGAYVSFKYKLEGDTLTTTFPNTPDIIQKVEINGDKMILSGDKGEKQELARFAGDPGSGIIGRWTGDHYTGGKQIIDFTTSQDEYLSVPFASPTEGTYKITGDAIEISGKTNVNWQWSIDKDRLFFTTSDGKKMEYVRLK